MSDITPPSREQLVQYFALYYATLGWRIIPDHAYVNGKCTCWKKADCGTSAGKHPRFDEWQIKATTEPLEIRRWFKDYWPRSNIGVATGSKSSMFVVDIDQKYGGMTKWKELIKKWGDIPPTPMTETGSGGNHIFFKWPTTVVVPTKSKLYPGIGIDLRGEGGQAVLPPSNNESGEYSWVENAAPWEVPVAEAPEWLLAEISAASVETGKESERFNVVRALCGVPEGERNHALVSLAGSLRAQDLPYDTAISWIIQAADNCDPPYPHDEAVKKVQWAYKKFEPGTSWKNVRRPYQPPIETIEWQTPVDFDEFNLPPFPIASFPGWVRNYIEAVAESTQTPIDMAGLCALSVLATACARKVRVFITNDWSEPLNLYTVTCARPGSRKS
ncbi:MAG: bifunctional DNA primase/polymerase, partial [Nitrososphaera sp.]|nr:bifunctional DNA primase/polymerase [Nitrososphaera sp.]